MTFVDGIASAGLPTDDRGLHYGDGLFETLALIDGEPQHWSRHLARLTKGALRLGIDPPSDAWWRSDLKAARDLLPFASRRVAKLLLTRGSGGRGYTPPAAGQSRRIVQLSDWPDWPDEPASRGVGVALCSTPLGRNAALAGLKHLNRLEQVLASAEVAAAGAREGLMFDDRDNLVEGTRTNVFVVVAGELLTPPVDEAGIAGIMRELILEFAAADAMPVSVAHISRAMLETAREVFLCNSLLGVWPVREILGMPGYTPGAWPLTQRVVDVLRANQALP